MSGINPTYIQGYASSITGIINSILVPVLISIAFIVFLWGIYNYFIKGADNEEARKTGKTFALYGIIGFVVLFSVWGIVNIFMGTLSLTAGTMPSIPLIGTGNGSSVIPAYGTTGMTAPQAQAYTAATQAQNTYNTICAQYGQDSNECRNASVAYERALQAWNAASGGTYSTGSSSDNQNSYEAPPDENGNVDNQNTYEAPPDKNGNVDNQNTYEAPPDNSYYDYGN